MRLQITPLCLGLEPGDEVLMQVDTCAADANAAFKPVTTLLFFRVDRWRIWTVCYPDLDRLASSDYLVLTRT